ncbi:hypothetical protein AX15_006406 [Amanita polypyramis BW_CC]|nr:hypothetical protein AX15_006406 [Amanita polypyramis BW_CC]
MNSPTEPASPTFSTPSSESPPPEEIFQTPQSAIQLAQITTQITTNLANSSGLGNVVGNIGAGPTGFSNSGPAVPGGSSSKRRQPYGIPARDRDAKSRRREPRTGASMGNFESQGGKEGGKKDKDEFVDAHIVERLRKEIGDPFLEREP